MIKLKKVTRKDVTEECTITITREDFMLWLRQNIADERHIPDDVEISIDASGCYCDHQPELDEDHDLIIRWKVSTIENSEE